MIKAGGTILEASVVDVWLPTRSEKARPYVTLSISTSWEESDVIAEMKRIKENKIKNNWIGKSRNNMNLHGTRF